MQLFLSFRASLRLLLASAALLASGPALAFAPSPSPVARTAIGNAFTLARTPRAAARPSFDALSARCDQEATRVAGSPACAAAAYEYLRGKGLSPDQAAGVVGNLWVESHGVSPKSHQFGGGPGRGIAQWTVWDRWRGVVALARVRGADPETLQVQLDFLWHELGGSYKAALKVVKASNSVRDATVAFQNVFEVPVGTKIGGPAYDFNSHPWAHTAERVQRAENAHKLAADASKPQSLVGEQVRERRDLGGLGKRR